MKANVEKLEQAALDASNNDKLAEVEPADLLLLIDEARTAPSITIPEDARIAEHCGPPWIIFGDEGKPVAIMPAMRVGDVIEMENVEMDVAQRIIECANAPWLKSEADAANRLEALWNEMKEFSKGVIRTEMIKSGELLVWWVRELYEAAHDVCLARDWDMGEDAHGKLSPADGVRLAEAVGALKEDQLIGLLVPNNELNGNEKENT